MLLFNTLRNQKLTKKQVDAEINQQLLCVCVVKTPDRSEVCPRKVYVSIKRKVTDKEFQKIPEMLFNP